MQRLRPRICPYPELLRHVPARYRLLDVGCGAGGLLLQAGARDDGVTGLGFDASGAAIAMAKRVTERAGLLGLQFEQCAVTGDWPSGTWDVIALIDLLHHVAPDAREAVVREAARRVMPGGTLIYKDMCRRPRWRAAMNWLHDLVASRQWIRHADTAEVERWFSEAGLQLTHSARLNRWWYGHDLRVFVRPRQKT